MCKTYTLVFASILMVFSQCAGSDLYLEIATDSRSVLVGLPIIIQLRISSNEDFGLDGDFNVCDGHTELNIRDEFGNPAPYSTEIACPPAERSPLDSDHKVLFDGIANTSYEVFLSPGKYSLSARYTSFGPYLDRYSETDQRPVEGVWIGELASNIIEIEVTVPAGEDQRAFANHGPPSEKLSSPDSLVWFLKLEGQEIVKEYPKSNYAAWVRWKTGLDGFNNYGLGMNQLSVQDQMNYNQYLKSLEEGIAPHTAEFIRTQILDIINAWEPLYYNFPKFQYRPFILRGLAQCYIRLGKTEKAIPMLKELMDRYPQNEATKKMMPYKEALLKNGLWK